MGIPLRIGIWFDARHMPYGGPTAVLLGTILGLYQDAETSQKPIVIVLNEPGDVNWNMDGVDIEQHSAKIPNITYGPGCFFADHTTEKDYENNKLWKHGRHFMIQSNWYRWCITRGLPFNNKKLSNGRTLDVWGAGVDIDRFCPQPQERKLQDYFIYFKSQEYGDLKKVHKYLFENYFHFTGSVLMYYHHDQTILAKAAQTSRFCIMLDKTETQGLASLEIMACDCPMFVLDWKTFQSDTFIIKGASSVPCWDERCGMKSDMNAMEKDFPVFIKALSTYKPREFVSEKYSLKAAAHALRDLITRKHHEG